MTSSRKREKSSSSGTASADSGQGGAHLNGSTAIRLGRAVLGERALHLALCTMNAQALRHAFDQRLHRTEHVRASRGHATRRRPESARAPFNRGEHGGPCVAAEEQLWRRPRRHVEDVLQRTPLFDMHGEVWRTLDEGETRRRLCQPGANTLDRIARRLLCAWRRDRTGDQQTHQSRGTQTHTVRTLSRRVQPEPAEHIRRGGR